MRRIDYEDFTVIRLDEPTDFCCVCDAEVYMDYGLPMYEGEIVPPDWSGEWGGFTACKRCYDTFGNIKEPLPVHLARRQLDREDGYRL